MPNETRKDHQEKTSLLKTSISGMSTQGTEPSANAPVVEKADSESRTTEQNTSLSSEDGEKNVQDVHKEVEVILPVIKKRCQTLKELADQSALYLDATTLENTPDFKNLLELVKSYQNGLALLLKECCYFFIITKEYQKAYKYAKELDRLANVLEDEKLKEEAKSVLSKNSCTGQGVACESIQASKKHNNILPMVVKFLQGIVYSSEHKKNEYKILRSLHRAHHKSFNMQESLNFNSECHLISSELGDRELTNQSKVDEASIHMLLGNYEKSYNILEKTLSELHASDQHLKLYILNYLCVVSLLLGKKEESLKFAWTCLDIAQKMPDNAYYISICHGNIGLAEEYLGHYESAIEHFQKCLDIGKETHDQDRIMNNSFCNLGRAYKGLGKKETAKEYFKKAMATPQPPHSHWCDTDEMHFSGDFLLAKMAIDDQNWPEAQGYLQPVVERCELQRKSVQESSLKIIFNDTMKKPYQYLQHVLLQQGSTEDALLVAENGRARDFYDKVTREEFKGDCLNTPQALLEFVQSQKVAVLMLSTLEVVNKLCGWFISPSGTVKEFSAPKIQWEDTLTQLCVAMYQLQGQFKTEFRGVLDHEEGDDDDDVEFKNSNQEVSKESYNQYDPNCQLHQPEKFSGIKAFSRSGADRPAYGTKSVSTEGSVSEDPGGTNIDTQSSGLKTNEECTLSGTLRSFAASINQLSELVIKPIEHNLDQLIESSSEESRLKHKESRRRNESRGQAESRDQKDSRDQKESRWHNESREQGESRGQEEPMGQGESRGQNNLKGKLQSRGKRESKGQEKSGGQKEEARGQGDSRGHKESRWQLGEFRGQGKPKKQEHGVKEESSKKEAGSIVEEERDAVKDEKTKDEFGACEEKPKLLIIPQGLTFNIPFATLQMNGEPLCNHITLLEAFSFHSFSHASKQMDKSEKECGVLGNALIVGNPTSDLPRAEEEAILIAKLLNVTPLIGTFATRSEVLSRLQHGGIIHLACHGKSDGKSLIMAHVDQSGPTESLLTVSDVAKLTIKADMVVLSACHTHRGKISSEGVLGLARAFRMAGAKSVVTALWAIPDKATKHFMGNFYKYLLNGQPVGDALSMTMSQMQRMECYKEVVHWGAFKVLGANCKVF